MLVSQVTAFSGPNVFMNKIKIIIAPKRFVEIIMHVKCLEWFLACIKCSINISHCYYYIDTKHEIAKELKKKKGHLLYK